MSWIEITEAEYLEVLSDAGATAWPRIPFRRTYDPGGRPPLLPPIYGRYYAGSEPMTNVEFRALRIDELALPK